MRKAPNKNISTWLKALKKCKINPTPRSLKELGPYRNLEEFLTEPIPGPIGWQYLAGCFRYLNAFALGHIHQETWPPLNRCWEDLAGAFIETGVFTDGVFVESWIFCDFPCTPDGKTVLDLFEDFLKSTDADEPFQCFIQGMRHSRLGLHQEVSCSQSRIRFTELITERTAEVVRAIEEFEKGEIFLIRLVPIEEEMFSLGDPKCFPAESKPILEGMVLDKLRFFPGDSTKEQYETFMKLAGPYWMSVVMPDPSFFLRPPDHYLTYRASPTFEHRA